MAGSGGMVAFPVSGGGTINVLNEPQSLDGNEAQAFVVFDVRPYTSGSFQIERRTSASWGTAVLTLERSNDRANWAAMATPVTAAAAGFTAAIDVGEIAFLRWRTSTAEGAELVVNISPCFKSQI